MFSFEFQTVKPDVSPTFCFSSRLSPRQTMCAEVSCRVVGTTVERGWGLSRWSRLVEKSLAKLLEGVEGCFMGR